MKRTRSKIQDDFTLIDAKRKMMVLRVAELQKCYNGHRLERVTLKKDLQDRITSILDGKIDNLDENIKNSMIEKINQFYDLTFGRSQSRITSMPNQVTIPDGYMSTQNENYPDVKAIVLPFYDQLDILMCPSSLIATSPRPLQVQYFKFYLTKSQVMKIFESKSPNSDDQNICTYDVQVLLRLFKNDTTCVQSDCYPVSFQIKVNDREVPLPPTLPCRPGCIPKRPPKPLDVTRFLKIDPTVANSIEVHWTLEPEKNFVIGAFLVHKRTSNDLLERLMNRGIKPSAYTQRLIKEKLNDDLDGEIATLDLRVSLMCPLGKTRMTMPCRASTCVHLQCFDAKLYLQMNERQPKWICPVCDQTIDYNNLVIDGYFLDVINALDSKTAEIQLQKDGSWKNLEPEIEANKAIAASEQKKIADIVISSDEDDDDDDDRNNNKKPKIASGADAFNNITENAVKSIKNNFPPAVYMDLTLDDD